MPHSKGRHCPKCNDTGYYKYDHNHSTVCDMCCLHDQGWWQLNRNHAGYRPGEDNSCCRGGCGTLLRDLPQEQRGDSE